MQSKYSSARSQTRRRRIIAVAALAGILGPVLFVTVLLALTALQYDFMLGIGWRPLADPAGVRHGDRAARHQPYLDSFDDLLPAGPFSLAPVEMVQDALVAACGDGDRESHQLFVFAIYGPFSIESRRAR